MRTRRVRGGCSTDRRGAEADAARTSGGRGGRWQGRGFFVEPLPPLPTAPSANAPFPHGLTGRLQCSATPRQQRLGRFWRFLPLPSSGTATARLSAVSPQQRLGYFSLFSPLPPDCTRPLRHSLSAFKSSPIDYQVDLPYSTAPFSVPRSLATAPRTGMGAFRCRTVLQVPAVQRGAFSVPDVPESGSRTTEGPFSVPDGESPQGYRVLRLRRSNLNTNMPIESNFGARL